MKKLLAVVSLLSSLALSLPAFADHHDVFISRIVKLSGTACAVELQISGPNQDDFRYSDEIRLDGSELVDFGSNSALVDSLRSMSSTTNDDGDKLLVSSAAFDAAAGITGDFSIGSCSGFDSSFTIAFFIDDTNPETPAGDGVAEDQVDTLSTSGGWTGGSNEAMTSTGGSGTFVDLDCDQVSVTNNSPTSVNVGTANPCGNGMCDCGENSSTCPADCGGGPVCGNDSCESGESVSSCCADCHVCGNLTCEACENSSSCPADCPPPVCPNGMCEPGENALSCPDDCGGGGGGGGGGSLCGNGFCNSGETAASCPQDCSAETVCGNGVCEGGETAANCADDCGGSVVCGDAICESPETADTCPADCVTSTGAECGNGDCETGETSSSCPDDCEATGGTGGGCSLIPAH